ncbi:hypothetical protein Ahy_A02g006909 [Arachis hypogaea]|uniref:Uncharacterized protein n=1 Tax=Arachis hypogaea TaxID=3818 RepID=A0A445EBI7_ARAHY|nr:hypothetical protein Ahy_A02g006909 [Arachis hypogaea]
MAIENHVGGEFLEPKSKKPFMGYVISRIKVYAEGTSQKKDCEIEPPYIDISGQQTPYKSFTLKIPQNVKKEKYEWKNWTQILFHEMNRDRDTLIRESEAMRLSKPSEVLLSSYCQVDSYDIDSDSD